MFASPNKLFGSVDLSLRLSLLWWLVVDANADSACFLSLKTIL